MKTQKMWWKKQKGLARLRPETYNNEEDFTAPETYMQRINRYAEWQGQWWYAYDVGQHADQWTIYWATYFPTNWTINWVTYSPTHWTNHRITHFPTNWITCQNPASYTHLTLPTNLRV